MGWHSPPFEIPADVAKAWKNAGKRSGSNKYTDPDTGTSYHRNPATGDFHAHAPGMGMGAPMGGPPGPAQGYTPVGGNVAFPRFFAVAPLRLVTATS